MSAFTPHRMHHVNVWRWGNGNKRYEMIRSKWKSWKTPFLWQRTCGTRLAIKWMGNEQKKKKNKNECPLNFYCFFGDHRFPLVLLSDPLLATAFSSIFIRVRMKNLLFTGFSSPIRNDCSEYSISHALTGKCTAAAYAYEMHG